MYQHLLNHKIITGNFIFPFFSFFTVGGYFIILIKENQTVLLCFTLCATVAMFIKQ